MSTLICQNLYDYVKGQKATANPINTTLRSKGQCRIGIMNVHDTLYNGDRTMSQI